MNTKLRIGGAICAGIMLIAGAFFFGNQSAANGGDGSVVVVPDGTRTYQETKDTDGDGMRDWEEHLQGTDPLVPNAPLTPEETEQIYGAGSSTEPLSNTVTSRFARTFFEKYFNESLGKETVEEAAAKALIDGSVDAVSAEVGDTYYTRASIHTTSKNMPSDLSFYGNAVGSILGGATVANENEVKILERALQDSTPEELKKLEPIIDSYQRMIEGILAVETPSSLANEHLNLLNTLLAIHNDVRAMRSAFEDPLPALLRIKRYENDAVGLFYALDNIRTAFERQHITFTDTEPGLFFFSLRP